MTALRIYSTNKPTQRFGPIYPMSREDERFWKLRRQLAERKQQGERA